MATEAEFLAATVPLDESDNSWLNFRATLGRPSTATAEQIAEWRAREAGTYRKVVFREDYMLRLRLSGWEIRCEHGEIYPLDADRKVVEIGVIYDTDRGPLKLLAGEPGQPFGDYWFADPETHRRLLHYPSSAYWPVKRAGTAK